MILDNVKNKIYSYVGKKCKFIYHGSRNQKDIFFGHIIKTYSAIFLIQCTDGNLKSFSYNDVLISSLEIIC